MLLYLVIFVFLHFYEWSILGDLCAKQHLTNSFDGDLSEIFVGDEEVMLEDQFLKCLCFLAGAIENEAVKRALERYQGHF